MIATQDRMLTAPALTTAGLQALFRGEIIAYRIPRFAPPARCRVWSNALRKSRPFQRYANAPDVPVYRSGMTLFEAANRPELLADYFQRAEQTHATIEKLLHGDNPLRLLQETLDANWPQGACRQRWRGYYLNPGILRSFASDSTGGLPPHVDTLFKDLPTSTAAYQIKTQLAANLYLQTPERGGVLHIWPYEPTADELEWLRVGHHDFLDASKLGRQPIELRPATGELILFRSSCVHAVTRVTRGQRTTASCFIGYYGETNPLRCWA
ncbi:MAG: 2OG-Fe(II) oxygenase [Bacteroidota bacterium]